MKTTLKNLSVALMLAGMTIGSGAVAAEKVVIAHRGASGYLPEHTLPAKAMAYAQGARLSGTGFSDDKGRPSGRPP